VASAHESNPARRTIQANTSTLRRGISEEKYQEPEERGLLYMVTHKTTKSNEQIDANSIFSKAIEKKSTSHLSWNNDIEQPTSGRHKKPQLQVNVASRKKVAFQEDGSFVGLGSSDKEENDQGEQTSAPRVTTGTQLSTPHVAIGTQLSAYGTTRNTNAQRGSAQGGGRGHGRGCGRTPGSHCFGAGGQSYRTVAPGGCTHIQMRSIRNSLHPSTTPSTTQQYMPGAAVTRNMHGERQSSCNWMNEQMVMHER